MLLGAPYTGGNTGLGYNWTKKENNQPQHKYFQSPAKRVRREIRDG